MSRHRIVRTMDYSDEYDGYDDVYGHSVDDDNCISPTDAQQWLYDRARGQESLSSFMATHRNIEEENEDSMNDDNEQSTHRRDSEDFQMPLLSDNDQARLNSCIDEIRTIVGETVSESRITDIILRNDFDYAKSLDAILNDNQTITTTSAVAVAAAASASASGVAGSNILPITKTIEKDLCINVLENNASSNTMVFNQIQQNNSSKTIEIKLISSFNNLSEFTNFHLKQSYSNSNLSSNKSSEDIISGTAIQSSEKQPLKFIIPKLGNSSKFIIPTFGINSKRNDNNDKLTPHELIMEKIANTKNNSNSTSHVDKDKSIEQLKSSTTILDSNNFIVDLSTALCVQSMSIDNSISINENNEKEILQNNFIPKFIDCDLNENNLQIQNQHFLRKIDCAHYLNIHLSNRSKKPISKFGRVLCRQYRMANQLPLIAHCFQSKHIILPFNFIEQSPDDIVLNHISLKKKK